jgi:uncharacterized protein YndB with AHSA1/START domain
MSSVPMLVMRRELRAAAGRVFDAWLEPGALARWMRPGSIEKVDVTVDAKIGGRFSIVMHGADGPLEHTGVYLQIERPRRLVFTWLSPTTEQRETLVTVQLAERADATEVTVTHELLPDTVALDVQREGWSDMLERLGELVASA